MLLVGLFFLLASPNQVLFQGNHPQEVYCWPLGVTVVVSKSHISASSVVWPSVMSDRLKEHSCGKSIPSVGFNLDKVFIFFLSKLSFKWLDTFDC